MAHEGKRNFFPEKHQTTKEKIQRMFQLHPQAKIAIQGLLLNTLRSDLLDKLIPIFKSLVASDPKGVRPKIGLFWGSHDIVVEFKHAHEVLAWPGAADCVTLVRLDGMGHESPQEDPSTVSNQILKFTGTAPRSKL